MEPNQISRRSSEELINRETTQKDWQSIVNDTLGGAGIVAKAISLDPTRASTILIELPAGYQDHQIIEAGQAIKERLGEQDHKFSLRINNPDSKINREVFLA